MSDKPKEVCAICGGDVKVRMVQPMCGWGAGFQGFLKPRLWCFRCCKENRGHYRLVGKR